LWRGLWDEAESALEFVLKEKSLNYQINPEDGAFYGPKIDFHILDSLGRSWQCGTVQLDFQMPEKFNCSYVGEDGKLHRPVLIHRAVYGSIERFMAILIEHFAGEFPLWLAPVQVKVLPIAEAHKDYAYSMKAMLELAGVRVEVDERNEKIGFKIREAEKQKIPYMLVVGDNEVANQSVAIRNRIDKSQSTKSAEEAFYYFKQEMMKK